ncbi:MAG TPA: hypothetical protein VKG26_02760, partial [Bacteroidia bacterium]|nr:hypothetical protein [Bacteroidia bacterium]
MKKILTPFLFALVLFSSAKAFSQTNLTWILSGTPSKGYFMQKTTFDGSFAGFTNANEVAAFCTKLKSNKLVSSVQNLGKDAAGNYKITISMKEPNGGNYYAEWLHTLNVAYIQVGSQKKS